MKVRELIEILNTLDQDSSIYSDLGDILESPWDFSVCDFDFFILNKQIDPNLKKVSGRPSKETNECKQGIVLYVKKSD